MPTGTLNANGETHQQSRSMSNNFLVKRKALTTVIASTLLVRVANRTSFVILSFYLGSQFTSAAIVAIILEAFYLKKSPPYTI